MQTVNDQKLDDWGKPWKCMNENQLKCHSKMGLVPEIGTKEYINWYNMFIDFLNDKNIIAIARDVALQFLDYLKDEKEYKNSSIRSIWSSILANKKSKRRTY